VNGSNKHSGPTPAHTASSAWDHSTHEKFYEYYEQESLSPEAKLRFRRVRDHILTALQNHGRPDRALDVADIGCGAGTQSLVWAELGHHVHALDVNGPLVELGAQRASSAGFTIDFQVGSATHLPWADGSVDVCIALELLEHVAEWKLCLKEFIRVLRPGGALFITTNNRLCPLQAEFNLPLYSWYPARVKHYYEKLAITTRPDIANYARYPAVNWFTFYGLRALLAGEGFHCQDRFDLIDLREKSMLIRLVVAFVRAVPVVRWFGQVCTTGTIILAIKTDEAGV
jgi:2-polyprenyl-6-hydroxyphenyl methylase/3-demethylubiquinone-9 3-methyltransferase